MAGFIQVILTSTAASVKACTYDAVTVVEKKAIINEKCTLCGACVTACSRGHRDPQGHLQGPGGGALRHLPVAEHRHGALPRWCRRSSAARELKAAHDRPISDILGGRCAWPRN
jgi:ferredoxin